MGVVLDHPSIGCAKSKLVGTYEELADEFGAHSPLIDQDEIVGAALRTQPGHGALFVSPGHHVSVDLAVRIALACCRGHSLMPIPTQAAHDAVARHTAPLRSKRLS
jgi:deoxyribonuclease V